jgi:hypothetical protein
MRGKDYFAAWLDDRSCELTAGLRQREWNVGRQYLLVKIRLIEAIVFKRNLVRLNRQGGIHKLGLPDLPVIRQVTHQDKNANEHDHALHCIPAFCDKGLLILVITLTIALKQSQQNNLKRLCP